jgi:hypothetical protein
LFDAGAYLIFVINGLELILIDLVLPKDTKGGLGTEFFDSDLPGRHPGEVAQRWPQTGGKSAKKVD